MTPKSAKSNLSVLKTIRLIEILAHAQEPLRLSELAAAADMPSSTTLRMINTLVDCGYAYQEDGNLQRYGLTMRFLQIGQMVASHFSIRDVAHPYLVSLSQETGESCCLSIEDQQRVRYLDVVENTQSSIVIRQRIGGSAPMHCTGSGKLFLSQYTDSELEEYIQSKGLPHLTPYTISNPNMLRKALRASKQDGYVYDNEECEIGMRCISAPVFDSNHRIIAAISLSGPVSRMTPSYCTTKLIPSLLTCSRRITDKVCGAVTTEEV